MSRILCGLRSRVTEPICELAGWESRLGAGMLGQDESHSTSVSLVSQVRKQDPDAWRKFEAIYGPLVCSWSHRYHLQAADIEDVCQEVMQRVWKKLPQYQRRSSKGSFRAWLWSIHHSQVIDHLRLKHREPNLFLDNAEAWGIPPEAPAPDEDERQLVVEQALRVIRGDFSEATWQAFWRLTVIEERPRDVAASLGLTPAAVCMARSRVLQRLRETLSDYDLD